MPGKFNVQHLVVGILLMLLAVGIYYRLRILGVPGLRITSWWRSPWKNEKVGGVLNSRHQVGLAFDVVPASRSTIDALQQIGFKKILDEGNHIHVEVV